MDLPTLAQQAVDGALKQVDPAKTRDRCDLLRLMAKACRIRMQQHAGIEIAASFFAQQSGKAISEGQRLNPNGRRRT